MVVCEARLGVREGEGANAGAQRRGMDVGARRVGAMKTRYRAREVLEMCDGGMAVRVCREKQVKRWRKKDAESAMRPCQW